MSRRNRLSDVKVGAFVLVALGILIVGSLWITGSTFIAGPRVPYIVLLKDSRGIQAGDRVRVAGVNVGRVQQVDLRAEDEWPVALQVKLKPEVQVRTDGTAGIATTGLLGAGFLEIDPGSPTAPPLPPGGEILGRSGGGLEGAMARVDDISGKVMEVMDQVSGILDEVTGQIGPLMARMDRLLSEENADNIDQILSNVSRTTEEVGPRVSSLLDRLESVAVRADEGLQDVPELEAKLAELIEDVRGALGPDGSRLAAALQRAADTLGSADSTLAVLDDQRTDIAAAVSDLRDTVSNLKAFSQQVKERPYSIVRIKAEPDRRPGQGVVRSTP